MATARIERGEEGATSNRNNDGITQDQEEPNEPSRPVAGGLDFIGDYYQYEESDEEEGDVEDDDEEANDTSQPTCEGDLDHIAEDQAEEPDDQGYIICRATYLDCADSPTSQNNEMLPVIGRGRSTTIYCIPEKPYQALKIGPVSQIQRAASPSIGHLAKALGDLADLFRERPELCYGNKLRCPVVPYTKKPTDGEWESLEPRIPKNESQDADATRDDKEPLAAVIVRRIVPFADTVRKQIVNKYFESEARESILSDPQNANFMVHTFLGERAPSDALYDSRESLQDFSGFLNYLEHHVTDARIGLMAKQMAMVYATMHWELGLDGRELTFILGLNIASQPRIHVLGVGNSQKITGLNVGVVKQVLVPAAKDNCSYIPRPDVEPDLFEVFKDAYLAASEIILKLKGLWEDELHRILPQVFLDELMKEWQKEEFDNAQSSNVPLEIVFGDVDDEDSESDSDSSDEDSDDSEDDEDTANASALPFEIEFGGDDDDDTANTSALPFEIEFGGDDDDDTAITSPTSFDLHFRRDDDDEDEDEEEDDSDDEPSDENEDDSDDEPAGDSHHENGNDAGSSDSDSDDGDRSHDGEEADAGTHDQDDGATIPAVSFATSIFTTPESPVKQSWADEMDEVAPVLPSTPSTPITTYEKPTTSSPISKDEPKTLGFLSFSDLMNLDYRDPELSKLCEWDLNWLRMNRKHRLSESSSSNASSGPRKSCLKKLQVDDGGGDEEVTPDSSRSTSPQHHDDQQEPTAASPKKKVAIVEWLNEVHEVPARKVKYKTVMERMMASGVFDTKPDREGDVLSRKARRAAKQGKASKKEKSSKKQDDPKEEKGSKKERARLANLHI